MENKFFHPLHFFTGALVFMALVITHILCNEIGYRVLLIPVVIIALFALGYATIRIINLFIK